MILNSDVAPSHRTLTVAAALVAVNVAPFILIADDLLDADELIARDEAVLACFIDHSTDWCRTSGCSSTTGGTLASSMA